MATDFSVDTPKFADSRPERALRLAAHTRIHAMRTCAPSDDRHQQPQHQVGPGPHVGQLAGCDHQDQVWLGHSLLCINSLASLDS